MKSPHANLTVLGVLVALAIAILSLVCPSVWFDIAVSAIGVGLFAQFVVLALTAHKRHEPPAFASVLLFAVWAAATYPLLSVMRPGMFPIWFTLASIPVGFVIAYGALWLFLTMLRFQSKLFLRGRDAPESDQQSN